MTLSDVIKGTRQLKKLIIQLLNTKASVNSNYDLENASDVVTNLYEDYRVKVINRLEPLVAVNVFDLVKKDLNEIGEGSEEEPFISRNVDYGISIHNIRIYDEEFQIILRYWSQNAWSYELLPMILKDLADTRKRDKLAVPDNRAKFIELVNELGHKRLGKFFDEDRLEVN